MKGKERKIYCFELSGLTPDNVESIYNRNLDRWFYLESSEAIVNGRTITGRLERELLMQPDKNGRPNIKTCTPSFQTAKGTPLTEQMFIDEKLRVYRPLHEKSVGSTVNRDEHQRVKIYLDFLEHKKLGDKLNYSAFAKELTEAGLIAGVTPEVLKSIIETNTLPETADRVRWSVKNRGNAWHFREAYFSTTKAFKKCIVFCDGVELHKKHQSIDTMKRPIPLGEPLKTIINKYPKPE